MKKSKRKILNKDSENKGETTQIPYVQITSESYKLKKKYTRDKPT